MKLRGQKSSLNDRLPSKLRSPEHEAQEGGSLP